jgi:ATP adenylyltransferase
MNCRGKHGHQESMEKGFCGSITSCGLRSKEPDSTVFAQSLLEFRTHMKHLWSPWRMDYIESPQEDSGCIFCDRIKDEDGPENLILHRGEQSFVILNRYPYTNGHMMVVPYVHVPSLETLDENTLIELMHLTNKAIRTLRHVYSAESFNIGINIGASAGAGVADHVHIHVVPRWSGDTNFMSTTAETRVLPEALEQTYMRIKAGWEELDPKE